MRTGLALLVTAALAQAQPNLTAIVDKFKPQIEESKEPRTVEGILISSSKYIGTSDGVSTIEAKVQEKGVKKTIRLTSSPYKEGVRREMKIFTPDKLGEGILLSYTDTHDDIRLEKERYAGDHIGRSTIDRKQIRKRKDIDCAREEFTKWRRILEVEKYETKTKFKSMDELFAALPKTINRENYDISRGENYIALYRKQGKSDVIHNIFISFCDGGFFLQVDYALTNRNGKDWEFSFTLDDEKGKGKINRVYVLNNHSFFTGTGAHGTSEHRYASAQSKNIMRDGNEIYNAIMKASK